MYYTFSISTSHIIYIFRVILPYFLLKNRFFLPQYQWNISQRRNLLIFSGKNRWNLAIFPVFSEEAPSFCSKLLFLDKRKKYTNPTAAVFLPIAYGIESCFLFRDPESTPTYFTFSAVLPLDTALHRRTPLPFPATLRRVPPCKCRPKCPIFAAHSAAKDSATRDSCPLLGKSASSHPHFFTDSITKRICNRFHVRSFLQRCKNQANFPDLSVQRFDGTISTPRVRSSMLRKERRKPAMPILA